MTTIDHRAFLWIVEQIAYTDVATLLAFRQTSRFWRDKADAQLFKHIILYRKIDDKKQVLKLENQHTPFFTDFYLEMRSPVAPYRRLPCILMPPDFVLHARDFEANRVSRTRSLKNVRTIDFHGSVSWHSDTSEYTGLADHFPNISLLRRRWRYESRGIKALVAPTTVDSMDFPPNHIVEDEESTARDLETHVDINAGVKRYVLHIPFDPQFQPFSLAIRSAGKPDTIDVIFEPKIPPGKDIVGINRQSFMFDLIRELRDFAIDGVKVTLVGIEQFAPGEDFYGYPSVMALARKIVFKLEGRDITPEEVLSRFTFMTRSEWLESKQGSVEDRLVAETLTAMPRIGPWWSYQPPTAWRERHR